MNRFFPWFITVVALGVYALVKNKESDLKKEDDQLLSEIDKKIKKLEKLEQDLQKPGEKPQEK